MKKKKARALHVHHIFWYSLIDVHGTIIEWNVLIHGGREHTPTNPGGGVKNIMAYKKGFRPKGVLILRFRNIKR